MLKIGKIENGEFYLKNAINSMEKYAQKEKEDIEKRFNKNPSIQKKDLEQIKLDKRKDLELYKIKFLNKKINSYMKKIRKNFPDPESFQEIQQKLIDTSEIDTNKIREERRNIQKIGNLIDEKTLNTERKIKNTKYNHTLNYIVNKHFKKIGKVFERFEETFKNLDKSRKFIKTLPKFEEIYTVAIAGYPNVGKSTLMKKVTNSDIEIQHYPFTTKNLMFSYIYFNEYNNDSRAIQIIDTPGLLNRDKENNIEKRASIVLTQFSEIIVFVIDFTKSCGYLVEKQIELLNNVEELGKKILIYESKTDLFTDETLEEKKKWEEKLKNYKVFDDYEKLKNEIVDDFLSSKKKLDPRKLKVIK